MFPIRLQGIHVLHEPRILKILVAMFWPFLSNKIRNRVSFFFPFVFLVKLARIPNTYFELSVIPNNPYLFSVVLSRLLLRSITQTG